jgi:hypothetical protein
LRDECTEKADGRVPVVRVVELLERVDRYEARAPQRVVAIPARGIGADDGLVVADDGAHRFEHGRQRLGSGKRGVNGNFLAHRIGVHGLDRHRRGSLRHDRQNAAENGGGDDESAGDPEHGYRSCASTSSK